MYNLLAHCTCAAATSANIFAPKCFAPEGYFSNKKSDLSWLKSEACCNSSNLIHEVVGIPSRKFLFPCLQAMPTITSIQIWQWLRYTIGPVDWTAPWTSPGRKSTNPRYDSSHPSPITTILFPLRRVTGVFAGEVPGCLPLMCVMICLWVPPQQDLCSNSFRSSHSLNTVLYRHNRNQSLAKKQNKMTNVYLFKHFGWSLPSRWGNQLHVAGAHVPCSFGVLCDIE